MDQFLFKNTFSDQLLAGVEQKRYVHELKIIRYLYVGRNHTSAEICRHLNISAPNAFSMLADLVEMKIIEKKGRGDSIGGRKPDLYGLQDNCFYVLAIEVGVYITRMAIFNCVNENLTGVKEFSISMDNQPDTLDVLVAHIQEFIQESGIDAKLLTGIGMSMPGLVDSTHGVNETYMNFGDRSLVSILEERLQKPVFIENDANAIALAEYRFGIARSKKEVLVINLDLGIGVGMILNGRLYRGFSGFSGEFGHIQMVNDGKLCHCGKLGCLETVASGSAIVRMAEEGVALGKSSIVLSENALKDVRLGVKQVVAAALSGDQYAIGIIAEAGFNIGKGISILIQMLNPEQIVLCGSLSEAGQYLMMSIKQAVQTHCMNQLSKQTRIALSEIGNEIGMKGALAVVMENLFESVIKCAGK